MRHDVVMQVMGVTTRVTSMLRKESCRRACSLALSLYETLYGEHARLSSENDERAPADGLYEKRRRFRGRFVRLCDKREAIVRSWNLCDSTSRKGLRAWLPLV